MVDVSALCYGTEWAWIQEEWVGNEGLAHLSYRGQYLPVSTLASLAFHFLLLLSYQPTSGVFLATTGPGIPGGRPSLFKG